MSKKKVIFVGWVNRGKKPVCGETTKNQFIIAELEKYCDLTILDFYEKQKHPWVYFQALWAFISKPNSVIIFSTTATNVYSILRLFKKLNIKREIIHWVIGGSFGQWLLTGKLNPDVFKELKYNLVQCHGMIKELNDAGVYNAKFVSNFKPIKYFPDLTIERKKGYLKGKYDNIRFVFVSRIMRDKGCDYIVKAVQELNDEGFAKNFSVDFYGKMSKDYEQFFMESIKVIDNVKYHGLLDLKSPEGYDTLASYHAMLFPTYWRGEGFAGIFIDAFVSGVPVLASDWAHNTECIIDGELGIIYPTHDYKALKQSMLNCINGVYDLAKMSENCRKEAPKYNAENALGKDYLRSIGLVD